MILAHNNIQSLLNGKIKILIIVISAKVINLINVTFFTVNRSSMAYIHLPSSRKEKNNIKGEPIKSLKKRIK